MQNILNQALAIWTQEYINQGSNDEGTCTIGDNISTPYGKIKAPIQMQGNVAKWKTAQPVLKFLAENGIKAEYNEGRMD
jgi:glutathione synthase/RimK-type ligase-like ATP-grasp enzyme